jgi:hypothetical protein
MKRALLIGLVAVCALMRPASAFAQSDFIDWLESFSGPGPFHGYFRSVNSRVFCTVHDGGAREIKWGCFDDTNQKIKMVLAAEVAWPDSDSNPRFADDPQNKGRVRNTRVLFNYYYRFNAMLDVGVGAGWLNLTGDDFGNQVHPIVTPLTLSFTPFGFVHDPKWARAARVLRVNYSERYVLKDIKAADFNAPLSKYFNDGEFNRGVSVGVDFWPFLVHR